MCRVEILLVPAAPLTTTVSAPAVGAKAASCGCCSAVVAPAAVSAGAVEGTCASGDGMAACAAGVEVSTMVGAFGRAFWGAFAPWGVWLRGAKLASRPLTACTDGIRHAQVQRYDNLKQCQDADWLTARSLHIDNDRILDGLW